MFNLSPIRLLIIAVVALIVLGPDKLPQFARQAGAAWKSLRTIQERVEGELREAVPDLPKTSDIARYARSPVSLLNKLADHATSQEAAERTDAGDVGATSDADVPPSGGQEGFQLPDDPPDPSAPDRPPVSWGDPSLN